MPTDAMATGDPPPNWPPYEPLRWPIYSPVLSTPFSGSLPPNHDMTRAPYEPAPDLPTLEKCPHCGKPLSE